MNHGTKAARLKRLLLRCAVLTALALVTFVFFGQCGTAKAEATTLEGFGPIDIRSPEFFWLIQSWKAGKLATIDGWGRFAEISFVGANRIEIKPLVNFPRTQLDRKLLTWPEAGLIAATTGKMHHLASVDDNKTKSHVPLLSWVHRESAPVLLDPREGLVGYSYSLKRKDTDVDANFFVYNYKEDRMVLEGPEEGFTILMVRAMDNRYALGYQGNFDGENRNYKTIFYNWRTNDIVENDLTRAINRNKIVSSIRPNRNMHPARRFLFGRSDALKQKVKVSWDEDYSNVKIVPLSYLNPGEGKGIDDFVLSADGTWGTAIVTGYRGLYNESLYKRAFFHLDDRYPNGISMAIMAEDYENAIWEYSAFVEHPVYGPCFAQEWHKKERGKDVLYLRLYRMDGVLAEINRRILETAKGVASQ